MMMGWHVRFPVFVSGRRQAKHGKMALAKWYGGYLSKSYLEGGLPYFCIGVLSKGINLRARKGLQVPIQSGLIAL
jgi:hypothetical protein